MGKKAGEKRGAYDKSEPAVANAKKGGVGYHLPEPDRTLHVVAPAVLPPPMAEDGDEVSDACCEGVPV